MGFSAKCRKQLENYIVIHAIWCRKSDCNFFWDIRYRYSHWPYLKFPAPLTPLPDSRLSIHPSPKKDKGPLLVKFQYHKIFCLKISTFALIILQSQHTEHGLMCSNPIQPNIINNRICSWSCTWKKFQYLNFIELCPFTMVTSEENCIIFSFVKH